MGKKVRRNKGRITCYYVWAIQEFSNEHNNGKMLGVRTTHHFLEHLPLRIQGNDHPDPSDPGPPQGIGNNPDTMAKAHSKEEKQP